MFTATGQTRTFSGTVVDTGQPYRVTLAWTDAPGSTTGNAFRNDLDLTVRVSGVTYRGNVFAGALSVAGGAADVRNNVESVFLPAGTSGTFTVTVTAANINSDGVPNVGGALDQDFALVVYNGVETPVPNVVAAGATIDGRELRRRQRRHRSGRDGHRQPVPRQHGDRRHDQPGGHAPLVRRRALAERPAVLRRRSAAGLERRGRAGPSRLTAAGTCGGALVATLQLQDGAADLGTASFTFTLGATGPGRSGHLQQHRRHHDPVQRLGRAVSRRRSTSPASRARC